jgi:hypothetical protein
VSNDAYSAKIDCDEDGFHLLLDGDFEVVGGMYTASLGKLDIRLDQQAAIELLGSVRETIGEWHAEGEAVRADFERWRKFAQDSLDGKADEYLPDYIQKENA